MGATGTYLQRMDAWSATGVSVTAAVLIVLETAYDHPEWLASWMEALRAEGLAPDTEGQELMMKLLPVSMLKVEA